MDNVKAEKTGAFEMASFGGAQFAASTYMAFTSYYLMMFFTDVAFIPPAVTAVLLFCFRLFSAADTQVIGIIINRRRFDDGKYRPYFKWLSVPFAVCFVALGLTPGVGASVRIFYAAFMLVLCDMCWTTLNLASISMLPYLAKDDVSRSKFMSFSNGSAICAYILVGTFLLPLTGLLGAGERNNGFAPALALLALISVPLFINAYFRLKERNYIDPPVMPAIKDVFMAIGRNKRLMLFLAGFCLYFMADAFKNLTTYYYMAHYMGRADLMPVVILAGLASPLAMQPIIPRLLNLAKKESLIIFGLFSASCSCMLMLAAGTRPLALIVCVVLYGVFTAIIANLLFTVMASFSDEMQTQKNISMSEMLAATINLCSNLGAGLASGAAAMAMAAFGYSAQAAAQTAGAVFGIRVLYILCTASGMVLSGAVLLLNRRSKAAK